MKRAMAIVRAARARVMVMRMVGDEDGNGKGGKSDGGASQHPLLLFPLMGEKLKLLDN